MEMMRVEPVSADRFADLEHTFTGGGDAGGCQCQWWTLPNAAWKSTSRAEREDMMRGETEAPLAPGLIAYVDGVAAGWVRIGPRSILERIRRSRTFAPVIGGSFDDENVWAMSCFSVRKEFRGRGLVGELIRAGLDFAYAQGADLVEAYPIDTDAGRTSSNDLYVGSVRVFLDAGFEIAARPTAKRAVVVHHRPTS